MPREKLDVKLSKLDRPCDVEAVGITVVDDFS
jgi:hypothetical protein